MAFQGAASQQGRKPLYYPDFVNVLEAEGKQMCVQTPNFRLQPGTRTPHIFLVVNFVACKVKVSLYLVNNKEIGKCNITL